MKVVDLVDTLGAEFYTGVPDSQLKALCDWLLDRYGTDPKHHIIAANEGNATALAAGYHLATSKIPVVYMQNSGEGNIINPVASLLSPDVYAIPCIFIIGWRGEPGVHDEPQHVYQGKVTLELLEVMDIEYRVLDESTTTSDVRGWMDEFDKSIRRGKSVAIVVRKGALEYEKKDSRGIFGRGKSIFADGLMSREEAIEHIVKYTGDDPIISTTGKASRELFEIRERMNAGTNKDSSEVHSRDFLTVGSMGHCSSIALGYAIHRPGVRVWCIDGDGAALMHAGAMAVIADCAPDNLMHIVINNGAHDTVGGQPTVLEGKSLVGVARKLGYRSWQEVDNAHELDEALSSIISHPDPIGPLFLEVRCKKGARDDLGRPTTTAIENKISFMGNE